MAVAPTSLPGILDSIDAPLLAIDLSGCVEWINDAGEQWLGRSRKRALGQALVSLEPLGPRLAALGEQALRDEITVHETMAVDGTTVTVAACPWLEAATLRGVVLWVEVPRSMTPGTERSDVSALAAGLAHEVRNPLAALRGAAELLSSELGSAAGESVREYVDLILREAGRVDALVARLLVVARPLALNRFLFRGDELLHDLAAQARALARARGVQAIVDEEYDPTLPALLADRERLFEALTNLVKNAVESLPPAGGRISLSAGVDAKRRRTAAGSRPLMSFAVRDTGTGLGASRDRLFTPFFTTKASGTGLGLLMARRAVEAHGGVLTLRDRLAPETGTEALVLIPLEANHG